jgi:AMMECR1 domain-containing protein
VSSAAAADAGWMGVRRDAAVRQKLAQMPRQAVAAYFRGTTYQPARSGIPVQGGVFVTFAAPGADGRLHTRACWGSLQPAGGDLATVVCQTTVAALTQDYRQPPVKSTELARLRIVISLVGPLSGVRNGERLQPRREGLYLTDGTRGAVLLPGEALTAEWQESACRQKAGIPPGKPVYRYRFQTLVIEEPQP